jgi:hypothetical protein
MLFSVGETRGTTTIILLLLSSVFDLHCNIGPTSDWKNCVLVAGMRRATAIFITFCLITAIILYVTPFQVVAVLLGVYVLRHPRFRDPLPAVPMNFFKRLPSQSDRIL